MLQGMPVVPAPTRTTHVQASSIVDLLYAQPCSDQLTKKVCVDKCYVDATTPPNLASTNICPALVIFGSDSCAFPDCKFYSSYAYLQKICVPYDYTNYPAVENNLNNEGLNVVLSNIAVTYQQLLIIGGGVIVLTVLLFLLFLCCPKIMYMYVTITFLGLLFLAFYSMKLSKVR